MLLCADECTGRGQRKETHSSVSEDDGEKTQMALGKVAQALSLLATGGVAGH